jgi:DNA invertase Pin-like site-specific DNA recombinase
MKLTHKKNMTALTMLIAALAVAVFTAMGPAYARDHRDDDQSEEHEEFQQMMMHIKMMNNTLNLVDRISEITGDESRSAVAAVMSLEEHFEEPEALVKSLEDLLTKVSDPRVKRAIRFTLADKYNEIDRPEAAREQKIALILGKDSNE